MRLSKTTGPGRPAPSSRAARRAGRRAPAAFAVVAAAAPVLAALAICAALLAAASVSACGSSGVSDAAPPTDVAAPTASPGPSQGDLVPGQVVEVDLDGDGSVEQVEIDPQDSSLTIRDGEVFYRSRDKWTVVQALLGDTDGDGLTEVITLLDSETGRHVGLFAYYGGSYRERLVSRSIDPAPLRLELVTGPAVEPGDGSPGSALGRGDLLMLIQPPADEGGPPQKTLLRWNGFGYIRVDS